MVKRTLIISFLVIFSFFSTQHAHAADWTFMVYLDGDNNLEDAAVDDFLEMSAIGSNSDINIVVQFDRIGSYTSRYGNWTDCQRFLITPGMTPETENAVSDWGDGIGGREVNMADPNTLVDFIDWAKGNYPAEYYAVILWNHGGGWRDSLETRKPQIKAVCWDDTSGSDSLDMDEIQQAFTTVGGADLIGFDACLMGMVEVAYEIKDNASVMVASEETEPGDGWPYDTLLADLSYFPAMTPVELGEIIVTRYGESYGPNYGTTLSAVDLTLMDTLVDSINNFAAEAMDSDKSAISTARTGSQEYYYPENIDLYHFAERLQGVSSDIDLQNALGDVMDAVEEVVIASYCDNILPDSHGLAIYFPERENSFDNDYNESIIDFPATADWDEFLQWFYASEISLITLLEPDDSAVLSRTFPATFSWEANPGYRFKIEFSPTPVFAHGLPTFTVPRHMWMPDTTTDDMPAAMWQTTWEIIKRIEQKNGIVYWRVIGRDVLSSPVEISEVRSFTISD